ncbi:hypothetical protein D3C81_1524400 [compost metagenome]
MNHRIAHLDASRVAVDQNPADLFFQQRHQPGERFEILRLADQGCGQLAAQAEQCGAQLFVVLSFDGHSGRAKYFFLQQRVGVNQQAGVSLEQLGAGLVAFLYLAGQVLDTGMGVQVFQPRDVAAQAAGVEQGLTGLLVEVLAEVGEQLVEVR